MAVDPGLPAAAGFNWVAISAVCAFGLLLVTGAYTFFTFRLLRETKGLREDQLDPVIVIRPRWTGPNWLDLYIENVGPTPAFSVFVDLPPELKDWLCARSKATRESLVPKRYSTLVPLDRQPLHRIVFEKPVGREELFEHDVEVEFSNRRQQVKTVSLPLSLDPDGGIANTRDSNMAVARALERIERTMSQQTAILKSAARR